MLAELGAEIIKVEFSPTGDPTRFMPFVRGGRSTYFVQQNLGKKSVCLNVKSDQGLKILKDLIRECDVFIENGAPGVIGRLGLDYETVKKINPRVIMCSISAYGQVGPLANAPGFDWCGGAYAGTISMIGERDGSPMPPQLAVGDVSAGMLACSGILAALIQRDRVGEGQFVDVSLLDAWFFLHDGAPASASVEGGNRNSPTRNGCHVERFAPMGVFKGSSRYFVIMVSTDFHFDRLCDAMRRPELGKDVRFATAQARLDNAKPLQEIIETWLGTVSEVVAQQAFDEHRVPAAPVLSVTEACAHPHLRERGTVIGINDPILGTFDVPGFPIRMSAASSLADLRAPFLGEHNGAILHEVLGYSEGDIEQLQRDDVLQSEPR